MINHTKHDRRFAYIYKAGGSCITDPTMIPEDKRKLVRWNPLDEEWQTNLNQNAWWSKVNIRKEHLLGNGKKIDERMVELHEKLLQFGGNETCFPAYEEDLNAILTRGQLWLGDRITFMPGRPSQCHSNSCELYELNKDKFEVAIATGYALSKDGLWRQHSWLMKRNARSIEVIETTEKRVLYFGFVMTPEEAEKFCENNP